MQQGTKYIWQPDGEREADGRAHYGNPISCRENSTDCLTACGAPAYKVLVSIRRIERARGTGRGGGGGERGGG